MAPFPIPFVSWTAKLTCDGLNKKNGVVTLDDGRYDKSYPDQGGNDRYFTDRAAKNKSGQYEPEVVFGAKFGMYKKPIDPALPNEGTLDNFLTDLDTHTARRPISVNVAQGKVKTDSWKSNPTAETFSVNKNPDANGYYIEGGKFDYEATETTNDKSLFVINIGRPLKSGPVINPNNGQPYKTKLGHNITSTYDAFDKHHQVPEEQIWNVDSSKAGLDGAITKLKNADGSGGEKHCVITLNTDSWCQENTNGTTEEMYRYNEHTMTQKQLEDFCKKVEKETNSRVILNFGCGGLGQPPE